MEDVSREKFSDLCSFVTSIPANLLPKAEEFYPNVSASPIMKNTLLSGP